MKTANFPRSVVSGCYQDFPFPITADDWLISITDAKWVDAEIELPFDKILFAKFDDVSERVRGCITHENAKTIADFIKLAREEKKNVWVNCHAGICRSGAIVSLLGDLGWEIVDHPLSPGRIPNHLVYNEVRKHFPEVTQSWDQPVTDIWVAAKGW